MGALVVAAALAAACSQEPLKFTGIQLGRSLNDDRPILCGHDVGQ